MQFNKHMINELKQAYEPLRGKRLQGSEGGKILKIMDKLDTNKDALIQLYKENIAFLSRIAVSRLIRKHNMTSEDINKL